MNELTRVCLYASETDFFIYLEMRKAAELLEAQAKAIRDKAAKIADNIKTH